jgi:hypothetical protein
MKRYVTASLLAASLAGCASGPAAPDPRQTFVSVVGTPFLIAFKIPVCAASVALAAPLGGATGLAPTAEAWEIRRDLDRGLTQNCGPPYVLSP